METETVLIECGVCVPAGGELVSAAGDGPSGASLCGADVGGGDRSVLERVCVVLITYCVTLLGVFIAYGTISYFIADK